MLKQSIVLLIALFSLFSCSPRGVVDAEIFPSLLADLYLTDKAITVDFNRVQRADTMLLYEPVFNKYGYTTDEFIKTIDFYLARPAKLKSFFTKAKDILEKRRIDAEQIIAAEELKKEILKKIMIAVSERDSLKETERHIRALRWIFAPDSLPSHRIYIPDSLATRYEFPGGTTWWINNLKQQEKASYIYEKDRRTLSLPPLRRTRKDGLSLSEH